MSNDNATAYYIGWDVGAWTCEKNRTSRDALVILDERLAIVGKPWRGGLRALINVADSTADFLEGLFQLCVAPALAPNVPITLAIDAPLGFSEGFVALVRDRVALTELIAGFRTNPYLHRQTDRRLARLGHKPLSPVQDMIGSQATKAMHFLAKYTPANPRCGVWNDGGLFTAIEAYPAPCKRSDFIARLRATVTGPAPNHGDEHDALTCALIAYSFVQHSEALDAPEDTIPKSEGWIWVPKDVLSEPTHA